MGDGEMKVASNGIQIRVHEHGTGNPALIFLHYWGGSSRTWNGVTAELSDRYRTIASDHRGWGDSDAPPDGYAISDLADDAQGVIEALNLKDFILVGHSMGGKVAQLLASRRPAGLKGLILVAPSPASALPIPDEQIASMKSAYDSREAASFVLDNVLTGSLLDETLREQVFEDNLRGAPQAKTGWPLVALREDFSDRVASINVPTLIVAGEFDKVDTIEILRREVLPRIAHARLEIIPGVGHLLPLEAPKALAAHIRAFASELYIQS
jgi:pimeloyl-ACP methyl ester carboxylesterase